MIKYPEAYSGVLGLVGWRTVASWLLQFETKFFTQVLLWDTVSLWNPPAAREVGGSCLTLHEQTVVSLEGRQWPAMALLCNTGITEVVYWFNISGSWLYYHNGRQEYREGQLYLEDPRELLYRLELEMDTYACVPEMGFVLERLFWCWVWWGVCGSFKRVLCVWERIVSRQHSLLELQCLITICG